MKFKTFVTFALEIEAHNAREAESRLDAQVSEMALPDNCPVNAIETTELVITE